MTIKKIVLVLVFIFVFVPVLALAKPADLPPKAKAAQTNAEARLTDAKLKSCQAKENAIKKRSDQLTKMANNMLDKFDEITARVKKYYTDVVVPSGKTVSNYDALLADIATKKTASQTVLTKAQDDAQVFSCTGQNPKGQLTLFRKDMQDVKKALKEYRTSIKNLIIAVRSATGQTESSKNK